MATKKKKTKVPIATNPENLLPSVLAVMIRSLNIIERSVGTMKGKLDTFSENTINKLDEINSSKKTQWTAINCNTQFRNRCIGGAKFVAIVSAIAGGIWGAFEFLINRLS